ncbi:helix-turn-helix domain-containing protein [Agrilactobacillus fermenti]|uniref:helix-turn-helix domain-containing protein n=1 Tax=Agrilactobacillus fermenti TaxID=2586909 RepID=UPI001E58802C|nr:helix-turn-helix domain-containing protein [Agrilactobacillus fermenti]
MTKFSSELKFQVVQEYLSGRSSYSELVTKYEIGSVKSVRSWVAQARENGLESLQLKHTKVTYSLEQKLAVVDYYQTSDMGVVGVAAHFGINPSQVCSWARIFKTKGIAGLRPKSRGRRPAMKHKKAKQTKKLPLSEKETYQQEILKLRDELYHTKMERDFLKKLEAVSKNNLPERKQK